MQFRVLKNQVKCTRNAMRLKGSIMIRKSSSLAGAVVLISDLRIISKKNDRSEDNYVGSEAAGSFVPVTPIPD